MCYYCIIELEHLKKEEKMMKNIPDAGFEQALSGNFSIPAILAHSGIRGDEDILFILDPNLIEEFCDFEENTKILYQFSKMTGKRFASWQEALVDLNFNGTEQAVVMQRWMNPLPWTREIIHCSPNKRIEM